MKVTQFDGVKNQFVITDDDGNIFFQSYDSIIVKIDKDKNIFLDEKHWNYSVTTSKHRNSFLRLSSKETEQRIKAGTIKLVNLNG